MLVVCPVYQKGFDSVNSFRFLHFRKSIEEEHFAPPKTILSAMSVFFNVVDDLQTLQVSFLGNSCSLMPLKLSGTATDALNELLTNWRDVVENDDVDVGPCILPPCLFLLKVSGIEDAVRILLTCQHELEQLLHQQHQSFLLSEHYRKFVPAINEYVF